MLFCICVLECLDNVVLFRVGWEDFSIHQITGVAWGLKLTLRHCFVLVLFVELDDIFQVPNWTLIKSSKKSRNANVLELPDFSSSASLQVLSVLEWSLTGDRHDGILFVDGEDGDVWDGDRALESAGGRFQVIYA